MVTEVFHADRSDTSEDDEEIDDQDVQKIIIVTQTPPAFKKHPGGDRTGQSYNRSKLTADIAQAINDGLYFYEQVSWWLNVMVLNPTILIRGSVSF